MKKITYTIRQNKESKLWCLFKYIEDERAFNFYPIVESRDKKVCEKKLLEIKGSGKNGNK